MWRAACLTALAVAVLLGGQASADKTLARFTCETEFTLLEGVIFGPLRLKSNWMWQLGRYALDRGLSQWLCKCPASNEAEFHRMIHMGSIEWGLNLARGPGDVQLDIDESDTDIACHLSNFETLKNEDVVVNLPSSCSYDRWVTDGICEAQVGLKGTNAKIGLRVSKCPSGTSPFPAIELVCRGSDCDLLGKPCERDSNCGDASSHLGCLQLAEPLDCEVCDAEGNNCSPKSAEDCPHLPFNTCGNAACPHRSSAADVAGVFQIHDSLLSSLGAPCEGDDGPTALPTMVSLMKEVKSAALRYWKLVVPGAADTPNFPTSTVIGFCVPKSVDFKFAGPGSDDEANHPPEEFGAIITDLFGLECGARERNGTDSSHIVAGCYEEGTLGADDIAGTQGLEAPNNGLPALPASDESVPPVDPLDPTGAGGIVPVLALDCAGTLAFHPAHKVLGMSMHVGSLVYGAAWMVHKMAEMFHCQLDIFSRKPPSANQASYDDTLTKFPESYFVRGISLKNVLFWLTEPAEVAYQGVAGTPLDKAVAVAGEDLLLVAPEPSLAVPSLAIPVMSEHVEGGAEDERRAIKIRVPKTLSYAWYREKGIASAQVSLSDVWGGATMTVQAYFASCKGFPLPSVVVQCQGAVCDALNGLPTCTAGGNDCDELGMECVDLRDLMHPETMAPTPAPTYPPGSGITIGESESFGASVAALAGATLGLGVPFFVEVEGSTCPALDDTVEVSKILQFVRNGGETDGITDGTHFCFPKDLTVEGEAGFFGRVGKTMEDALTETLNESPCKSALQEGDGTACDVYGLSLVQEWLASDADIKKAEAHAAAVNAAALAAAKATGFDEVLKDISSAAGNSEEDEDSPAAARALAVAAAVAAAGAAVVA